MDGSVIGRTGRETKSLYGSDPASRSWHAHLTACLTKLGFHDCLGDGCVVRLGEQGRLTITAIVGADGIFNILDVGRKSSINRCSDFCEDLGRAALLPVKSLGELRWYGGCQFTRGRLNGLLKMSPEAFADSSVETFGAVIEKNSIPMPIETKLEEFNKD